jgi:transporter family protein
VIPVIKQGWLFWSLLSAVFAGATAILAKLGVEKIDSNLATAIRTSIVVVFTWLIVLVAPEESTAPSSLAMISGKSWIFLTFSGLATGLSWMCYFRALKLGPASRVAPIDKLSVALVIVLSALFLGERLTWAKALGGLLIVSGAIVIALE